MSWDNTVTGELIGKGNGDKWGVCWKVQFKGLGGTYKAYARLEGVEPKNKITQEFTVPDSGDWLQVDIDWAEGIVNITNLGDEARIEGTKAIGPLDESRPDWVIEDRDGPLYYFLAEPHFSDLHCEYKGG